MRQPRTFLILGGARSGKTRHALQLAMRRPKRTYIATADAHQHQHDEDMRGRIARHQRERDHTWTTREVPLALAAAIAAADQGDTSIVVDCLTLWLSNLMGAAHDVDQAIAELESAIATAETDIILVSNEVGLGIVPTNALAREFRDLQGLINQRIAAAVDHVDFVAAGLALNIKPGLAP